jgi:hypothetical protein
MNTIAKKYFCVLFPYKETNLEVVRQLLLLQIQSIFRVFSG